MANCNSTRADDQCNCTSAEEALVECNGTGAQNTSNGARIYDPLSILASGQAMRQEMQRQRLLVECNGRRAGNANQSLAQCQLKGQKIKKHRHMVKCSGTRNKR